MILKELEHLKEMIHLMCRKTEGMYFTAIEVLKKRDTKLLHELLEMDKDLNSMEVEVDNTCLNLLALKDPYAIDFRYIISIMKSTRDLERIGDESKTIGKWSIKSDVDLSEYSEFHKILQYTTESIKNALGALMYDDLELAEKTLQLEIEIDDIEEILLAKEPSLATGLIIRAMERIGDLSSNIAENVIYYLQGKDIRHQH